MNIIKDVGTIFSSVFSAIKQHVSGVVNFIQQLWNTFGKDIVNTIKKYLGMVQDVFKSVLKAIEGVFDIFAGIFSGDWSKVWDGVKKVVDGVFSAIKTVVSTGLDFVKSLVEGAFKAIISFIGGVGNKIAGAAKGMWDGIWEAFRAVINTLIRGWNSLKFTLPEINFGPIHLDSFTIGTPNIPYLHKGGIVPGAPGSDQLAILQAGERVIPRNQSGAGNVTVNINIGEGAYIDGPSIDRLANIITKRMRYATGT
jgi:hypothetical protein